MLAGILLRIHNGLSLPDALMTLILSFMVFSQIKLFGMGVSMLRMTAAAIDRTIETEQMPRMDENGKAISPEKHDIVFDHVNFSYEQKPILHDISVTLPDKTTTEINTYIRNNRSIFGFEKVDFKSIMTDALEKQLKALKG